MTVPWDEAGAKVGRETGGQDGVLGASARRRFDHFRVSERGVAQSGRLFRLHGVARTETDTRDKRSMVRNHTVVSDPAAGIFVTKHAPVADDTLAAARAAPAYVAPFAARLVRAAHLGWPVRVRGIAADYQVAHAEFLRRVRGVRGGARVGVSLRSVQSSFGSVAAFGGTSFGLVPALSRTSRAHRWEECGGMCELQRLRQYAGKIDGGGSRPANQTANNTRGRQNRLFFFSRSTYCTCNTFWYSG